MRPPFVETLAAWCVVPYDDRPRTPAQRADALAALGIEALAWDWRDEHVVQFGEQLDALSERGLGLAAIWARAPVKSKPTLLVGMTRRLAEHIMVMVARKQRGDGDELLSPLVNPALPVVEALAGLLQAAAVETSGADEPRAGLPQVIDQLRSMADLLETMTPREYL